MSKRFQISQADDYQYFVIGIASDERIWKVCWEINQHLDLQLLFREINPETVKQINENPSTGIISLFSRTDWQKTDWWREYYEDTSSHSELEFALFANDLSISPKKVHPFRYFFLIRASGDNWHGLKSMLSQLNQIRAIRSAVDITGVKNINSIIL